MELAPASYGADVTREPNAALWPIVFASTLLVRSGPATVRP
jgi:hypothetical protein